MDVSKAVHGVLFALAFAPTAAGAQCNEELFSVTGWETEVVESEPRLGFNLDVSVRFNGDRPIRMVDGSIVFGDVLGGRIGSMGMDRDISLQPGEDHVFSGYWGRNTFERLIEMRAEDVTARTCVRGIVYEDGELVSF